MKYILPNFYDSYMYNIAAKDALILNNYNISGIQGTFSFCIFNGSINNIRRESIALYPDIVSCPKDYGILNNMVLLDFGNTLIEKKDFHNNLGKVIFEEYSNASNFFFEIGLENFIDYVIETYPLIQIILHQNYIINHSEEEVQTLINKYPNNIKGIICTKNYPCSSIQNIIKFYLLDVFKCQQCLQYKRCIKRDMECTLKYSIESIFNTCNYMQIKSIEELKSEIFDAENNKCEYILFNTIPMEFEEQGYNAIMSCFIEELQGEKQ